MSNLLARNDDGELKRLSDLRSQHISQTFKKSSSQQGKFLEQSRFIFKKVCLFCGCEFEGIKTAKYHSESCKQKAKRFRNANVLKQAEGPI
jgi:hypothetical protein